MSPNRVAPGVPTGGQFAPDSRGRATVTLDGTATVTTVSPADLQPGDVFLREVSTDRDEDVEVEIIGEQEPHTDPFGQQQFKYMARRFDTGAEGYVIYGPGAASLDLIRRAEKTPDATPPRLEWFEDGKYDDGTMLVQTPEGYLLSVRPKEFEYGTRWAFEAKHPQAAKPLQPLVSSYHSYDSAEEAQAAAALSVTDGLSPSDEGDRVSPEMMREPGFLQAVHGSREHLPIITKTTRPESQSGMTIVRETSHNGDVAYRAYKSDAWDEPSQQPVLPWSPPKGEKVASLDMNGRLAAVDDKTNRDLIENARRKQENYLLSPTLSRQGSTAFVVSTGRGKAGATYELRPASVEQAEAAGCPTATHVIVGKNETRYGRIDAQAVKFSRVPGWSAERHGRVASFVCDDDPDFTPLPGFIGQ